MTAPLRRYPFVDLAIAVGMSEHATAKAVGISGSTEFDYRRRGVTERVGDRLAVALGLVAYDVWPQMLEDALADHAAEQERRRAAKRRRDREYAARRRADPAKRAADVERVRAYRADPRYRENELRANARRAGLPESKSRRRERNRGQYDPEVRRASYLADREATLARMRAHYAARRNALPNPQQENRNP